MKECVTYIQRVQTCKDELMQLPDCVCKSYIYELGVTLCANDLPCGFKNKSVITLLEEKC